MHDVAFPSPSMVSEVSRSPRFLDQVRQAALEHYDRANAAERCVDWARRFILIHNKQHPSLLGVGEVTAFLKHVAAMPGLARIVDELNNAREALSLVHEHVLQRQLGEIVMPQPPRLLDRLRQVLRTRHYSPRTEECYVDWAAKYIRFHGLKHPQEMRAPEVCAFLTDLAVSGHVAASTQNQALNALVFLYQQVLGLELGRLDAVRARRPKYLPVVPAPEEIKTVLDAVEGERPDWGTHAFATACLMVAGRFNPGWGTHAIAPRSGGLMVAGRFNARMGDARY